MTQVKCANCGAPQTPQYQPFCSKRCADIDLHRWLSGSYVIAGKPDEDEDGGRSADDGPGRSRDDYY